MPKDGFTYRDKQQEFFTGLGIENPKHDLNSGILLRTAHCMGGINFFFVVGEEKYPRLHSDTSKSYKSVPSFKFKDFDDMMIHRPECCEIVGVELCERSVPLETFKWPPRVIILLGGEDSGLSRKAIKQCRYMVKLPSSTGISLNLSSAGAMILYHRYLYLSQLLA